MQPTQDPTAPMQQAPMQQNPMMFAEQNAYATHFDTQPPLAETTCPYIVHGQWRDGICDFCSPGSKPAFWMALFGPCCWPCLIAKIAARIRFSPGQNKILGNTPFKAWLRILTFVTAIMWLFWFLSMKEQGDITMIFMKEWDGKQDGRGRPILSPSAQEKINEKIDILDAFDSILSLLAFAFTLVICMVRLRTRAKFHIPSSCDNPGRRASIMGIFEDFCCAWWCACCSLAQMARHTHATDGDQCNPCLDPGPAETMPAPGSMGARYQPEMQVFATHQPNSMYQPPVAIPVAIAVTPVQPQPGDVLQGQPVPAAAMVDLQAGDVYDAKRQA